MNQRQSLAAAVVVLAASVLVGEVRAAETVVADARAFANAIKTAKPGDTLVLKAGEWKDAELRVAGEGAPDAPITVRAEVPGKTIFTGASSIRIGGKHLVVDGVAFRDFKDADHLIAFRIDSDEEASNCRLTNVSIESPEGSTGEGSSFWVSLYGQRNRVDHCHFKGKRTSSPTLTVWVGPTPNDHRIDHNFFEGRPPLGKNGGETMRVGTSQVSMNVSRTIVEDNLFERCDGESEIISNKSCDNVYRRNVFVECQGGLTLRHGNRAIVDANRFLGNDVDGTGGVRVIGEDHRVTNNYFEKLGGTGFMSALSIMDGIENSPLNGYYQVKRATVAFNTIVDCRQSMVIGLGHGERDRKLPALDCVIANNLIVSSRGPLVTVLNAPQNASWMGNVLWGADTGADLGAGASRLDPTLTARADGLQHPTNLGLAKASSLPTHPVTTDIDGQSRDAQTDVGCDQMAPTLAPFVRRADVGPRWMKPVP